MVDELQPQPHFNCSKKKRSKFSHAEKKKIKNKIFFKIKERRGSCNLVNQNDYKERKPGGLTEGVLALANGGAGHWKAILLWRNICNADARP